MFDKQIFAKRLKELREKCGLNQSDFAEKCGTSRGSISFYEKGERLPDIETIFNMAKHFNVSADYLIGLSDVSTKNETIRNVADVTGLSEKAVMGLLSVPVDVDLKNSIAYSGMFEDYLGIEEYFNYIPITKNKLIETECFSSLISAASICRVASDMSKKIVSFNDEQFLRNCDNNTINSVLEFCRKWKREYNYQIFIAQNKVNNFIRYISSVDEDEITKKLKEVEDLIWYIQREDIDEVFSGEKEE